MRDYARKYEKRLAPTRPSATEDPNQRVPKDRTTLDYPTDETLAEVAGFVPSAPDPAPVYVVQNAPARRNRIRRVAGNMTLTASNAAQICGADLRRRRVFLRNLDDTHNVYMLPDGTTINIGGFKLEPAQDVELFDNDEVWLMAEANDVDVTWILEYEIDE